MKRSLILIPAMLGVALLSGRSTVAPLSALFPGVTPALAAESESGGETVRPEVGKLLQAAQHLIEDHKYDKALATLHAIDDISGRTAYENSVVERMRLTAALGAESPAVAAKAYQAAVSFGSFPAADRLRFIQAIAVSYYRAKDYASAALWGRTYAAAGGGDPEMRTLLAQAYYLGHDFTAAANTLTDQIAAEERGGREVPEAQLQLLASSVENLKDPARHIAVLEKLVFHYPKPDYWTRLIHEVTTGAGFTGHLDLEVARLRLATGALEGADRYMEMAEQALQAGFPGEAKTAMDSGYGAGMLGNGPEASRHQRLRDLVDKTAAQDLKALPAAIEEAERAETGTGLVNSGFDYVGYGQADKGLVAIEQGLARGGLKRPEEARLHLGIAYLAAGAKAKAIATFKTIRLADGTAALARLWTIKAGGMP
jgi:hypothetical protein